MHRWFHMDYGGKASGGERKGGRESGRRRRMSSPSAKRPTQQRRGLEPLFFLNVTQHLFHIYDGGAAFADAPFNHGGDPIAAPDYPRYPPMHNL